MTTPLERRLAQVILAGREFTADDVTDDGQVTIDSTHAPNAKQNGIGSLFNHAARNGLIQFTGSVTRSSAPRRKGGAIRVWVGTVAGVRWAQIITTKEQP